MEIILDMREKKLHEACMSLIQTNEKMKDIQLKIENLHIGDCIIKHNGCVKLIIERKSIPDLISSIKDKRYEEQSFRLNELEHHNHNIIYLIEGSCEKYNKEKQMIYSAMFALNYYKGFSVFRSMNMNESAYILCNIILKINIVYVSSKKKEPYYLNSFLESVNDKENKIEPLTIIKIKENEETVVETIEPPEDDVEKEYCGLVFKKKNAMITPENISEIFLVQIPSINKVTAIEILKKSGGSINSLICNLNENPRFLDGMTYMTKNNKCRKISKTSIENILRFLKIN